MTPKNVRFLFAIEIAIRMLCAWLPPPWPWAVFGLGALADLGLYRACGGCKDPVSYNLFVRTNMYSEKTE